jgi:hypothetical protein
MSQLTYVGTGLVMWTDAWSTVDRHSFEELLEEETDFGGVIQANYGEVFVSSDGQYTIVVHNYVIALGEISGVEYTVIPSSLIINLKVKKQKRASKYLPIPAEVGETLENLQQHNQTLTCIKT